MSSNPRFNPNVALDSLEMVYPPTVNPYLIPWLKLLDAQYSQSVQRKFCSSDHKDFCSELMLKYNGNVEFCWRTVRSYGNMIVDKNCCCRPSVCFEAEGVGEKPVVVLEVLDLGRKWAAVYVDNVSLRKWVGIVLWRVSEKWPKDKKEQLELVNEAKIHLDFAVERRPSDFYVRFMLGTWFYSVADMGWLNKGVASVFYKKDLPKGTFEEAVEHLRAANFILPNNPECCLILAKCFLKLKRYSDLKEWVDKGLATNPRPCQCTSICGCTLQELLQLKQKYG